MLWCNGSPSKVETPAGWSAGYGEVCTSGRLEIPVRILTVATATQYSAVRQLLVFCLNGHCRWHLMIISTLSNTLLGPNLCQRLGLSRTSSQTQEFAVHLLQSEPAQPGRQIGVLFQWCQSAWCTLAVQQPHARRLPAAGIILLVALGLVTMLWRRQDKTNTRVTQCRPNF